MDTVLRYAVYLACPISMGLMMWWMMRGHRPDNNASRSQSERIAQLEREVDSLRGDAGHDQPHAGTRD